MVQLRKSLPFRIFLIFTLLLCLPLFIDSFILVSRSAQEAVENAQSVLLETSSLREYPLSELFPSKSPIARLFANELDLKTYFPQAESPELNKKLDEFAKGGGFSAIVLLSYHASDGMFKKVAAATNEKILNVDPSNNLKSVSLNNEGFTTIWVEGESEFYFLNAYFVYSDKKELLGALLVYEDISEKLNNLLQPSLGEVPIFFGILLPSSIVFSATDKDLVMNYFAELSPETRKQMQERVKLIKEQNISINPLPEHHLPIQKRKEYPLGDFHFFEFTWRDEVQIARISEMGKTGYYLLAYVSKSQVLQNVYTEYSNVYKVYALILVLGGLISFALIMRLSNPLNVFIDTMNQVAEGKEETRYRLDPLGFEINHLGSTFNEMLDSLVAKKKIVQEEHVKRELYKQELNLGEKVQRRLFLENKVVPQKIDVASLYMPALEVGGDFCDLFMHNDKLVLMIADAAGKGVEACFYSLIVRSLLRILSQEIADTAQVIQKANHLFLRDVGESGFFVTVLLAFFDTNTHKLTYYSGGHNPPVLRRKEGTIEMLAHHGPALGIDLGPQMHHAQEIFLNPGDLVVFYTDGVTEAHSLQKKLFSEKRLIKIIENAKDVSSQELLQEILKQIKEFENGEIQHDDITMMVMKLKEGDKNA